MACRECARAIEPDLRFAGRKARSFDTCVYRCECGVGYSNARSAAARRRITSEPAGNVPREVSGGLEQVLANAVNVRNRPEKRGKFCSETAEDAVTWTVFTYLASRGDLGRLLDGHGEAGEASLLVWGVPFTGPPRGGRRGGARAGVG